MSSKPPTSPRSKNTLLRSMSVPNSAAVRAVRDEDEKEKMLTTLLAKKDFIGAATALRNMTIDYSQVAYAFDTMTHTALYDSFAHTFQSRYFGVTETTIIHTMFRYSHWSVLQLVINHCIGGLWCGKNGIRLLLEKEPGTLCTPLHAMSMRSVKEEYEDCVEIAANDPDKDEKERKNKQLNDRRNYLLFVEQIVQKLPRELLVIVDVSGFTVVQYLGANGYHAACQAIERAHPDTIDMVNVSLRLRRQTQATVAVVDENRALKQELKIVGQRAQTLEEMHRELSDKMEQDQHVALGNQERLSTILKTQLEIESDRMRMEASVRTHEAEIRKLRTELDVALDESNAAEERTRELGELLKVYDTECKELRAIVEKNEEEMNNYNEDLITAIEERDELVRQLQVRATEAALEQEELVDETTVQLQQQFRTKTQAIENERDVLSRRIAQIETDQSAANAQKIAASTKLASALATLAAKRIECDDAAKQSAFLREQLDSAKARERQTQIQLDEMSSLVSTLKEQQANTVAQYKQQLSTVTAERERLDSCLNNTNTMLRQAHITLEQEKVRQADALVKAVDDAQRDTIQKQSADFQYKLEHELEKMHQKTMATQENISALKRRAEESERENAKLVAKHEKEMAEMHKQLRATLKKVDKTTVPAKTLALTSVSTSSSSASTSDVVVTERKKRRSSSKLRNSTASSSSTMPEMEMAEMVLFAAPAVLAPSPPSSSSSTSSTSSTSSAADSMMSPRLRPTDVTSQAIRQRAIVRTMSKSTALAAIAPKAQADGKTAQNDAKLEEREVTANTVNIHENRKFFQNIALATASGDHTRLVFLLGMGFSPNTRDVNNRPLLEIAIRGIHENFSLPNTLKKHQSDTKECQSLLLALESVVKLLLENGGEWLELDQFMIRVGQTGALPPSVYKILRERDDYSPFYKALIGGDVVRAEESIKSVQDIDRIPSKPEEYAKRNFTYLHIAVYLGSVMHVSMLVSNGANTQKRSNGELTPLHLLLLEFKVDSRKEAEKRELQQTRLQIAECLLAGGADPEAETTNLDFIAKCRKQSTKMGIGASRPKSAHSNGSMERALEDKSRYSKPIQFAESAGDIELVTRMKSRRYQAIKLAHLADYVLKYVSAQAYMNYLEQKKRVERGSEFYSVAMRYIGAFMSFNPRFNVVRFEARLKLDAGVDLDTDSEKECLTKQMRMYAADRQVVDSFMAAIQKEKGAAQGNQSYEWKVALIARAAIDTVEQQWFHVSDMISRPAALLYPKAVMEALKTLICADDSYAVLNILTRDDRLFGDETDVNTIIDTVQQFTSIEFAASCGAINTFYSLLSQQRSAIDKKGKSGRTLLQIADRFSQPLIVLAIDYFVWTNMKKKDTKKHTNKDRYSIVTEPARDNVIHMCAVYGRADLLRFVIEEVPELVHAANRMGQKPIDSAKVAVTNGMREDAPECVTIITNAMSKTAIPQPENYSALSGTQLFDRLNDTKSRSVRSDLLSSSSKRVPKSVVQPDSDDEPDPPPPPPLEMPVKEDMSEGMDSIGSSENN